MDDLPIMKGGDKMAQLTKDGKLKKSYSWAFMLYPESAPPDWINILRDSYRWIAVSPCHDRDIFTVEDEAAGKGKAGDLKKPHYHIQVFFNNSTTSTVAEEISESVNGTFCIAVDAWNYFGYLDHDHVTGKAKYRHEDIQLLNGFTEADIRVMSAEEQRKMKLKVISFIKESYIYEYSDFLDGLISNDLEMFDYATEHLMLFRTYIDSRRNKELKKIKRAERGK